MLDRVRKTIQDNNLLDCGDSVICAVSGGADSICLLHTMLTLKSEYNLSVYVANVNHMLRGEEADGDSEFVRKIARAADVEFFYREYDVVKIAHDRKLGEEECGRVLRYEFFDELSRELDGAKIATAHNLNDNAETVLFRLARGTSSQGMCGIKYKRGNIIRPLLDIPREDIEKYLRTNSITWREDSTNAQPIYARNKLRLGVMPILEEISPGAQKKIVCAASYVSEDNKFIGECTQSVLSECFFDDFVLVKQFCDAHISIQRRIAYMVLEKWGAKETDSEKIEKFIEFFKKESGKQFDIDAHFYAEKSYDRVVLCQRIGGENLFETLDIQKDVCGKNWRISVAFFDEKPGKNGNNTAVFDAEKLFLPLVVRYRKEGDKIAIKGLGGSKKLSDIFSDEKVERQRRDFIPIVEKDGQIIYVGGLRQSSLYSADENTKKYIVIKYTNE